MLLSVSGVLQIKNTTCGFDILQCGHEVAVGFQANFGLSLIQATQVSPQPSGAPLYPLGKTSETKVLFLMKCTFKIEKYLVGIAITDVGTSEYPKKILGMTPDFSFMHQGAINNWAHQNSKTTTMSPVQF